MHEKQGQYKHNNTIPGFPRLLYDKVYKIKVKISAKLVVFDINKLLL